jgi:hypothetical protein
MGPNLPLDCSNRRLPIGAVSSRINGASILARVQLGPARWLVLCEDGADDCTRYRVGYATVAGHLSEDALHVTRESAQADFDARWALATGGKT